MVVVSSFVLLYFNGNERQVILKYTVLFLTPRMADLLQRTDSFVAVLCQESAAHTCPVLRYLHTMNAARIPVFKALMP